MVDMESHHCPPSPLDDSVLGSPLHAHDDFIGSMEELQDISQDISKDISQSIDNDTLSSLDIPEYQSSSNGSESSTLLGEGFFFFLPSSLFFFIVCLKGVLPYLSIFYLKNNAG